jgi:hypothetical protein
MNSDAFIEDAIRSTMTAHGFRHESIGTSPEIFVMEREIAPYYWYLPYKDERGVYSISGAIGVIDRTFEAEWTGETLEKYPFPLCLLSVNIRELIGGWVHPDFFKPDGESYLGEVAAVVKRLPADRAALRAAFTAGEMLGIDMETWGLMSVGDRVIPTPKYLAFRAYMLA